MSEGEDGRDGLEHMPVQVQYEQTTNRRRRQVRQRRANAVYRAQASGRSLYLRESTNRGKDMQGGELSVRDGLQPRGIEAGGSSLFFVFLLMMSDFGYFVLSPEA